MTAVIHIAGLDIQVGRCLRQRCGWCGAALIDYALNRIAVAIPEDGSDPGGPATWRTGALVAVDGGASYAVAHEDGGGGGSSSEVSASLGTMTEPTSAPGLERAVRAALRRRLQLSRAEDHERWDDECVAAILRAVETADTSFTLLVQLAEDGAVTISDWTFPESGTGLSVPARDWAAFVAAVKAVEYDEMVSAWRTAQAAALPGAAAASGQAPEPGPPAPPRQQGQQPRRTARSQRAAAGKGK